MARSRGIRGNRYRHGQEPHRLYGIWEGMRHRCRNQADPRYGGRGIAVCQEWDKFELFRDWALANGYAEGLTLDRRDNDLGYSPLNCRWATGVEQCRNRRSNKSVVRSDGVIFASIAEAAEKSATSLRGVWNACNGWAKTAGGFTWEYYGIEKREAA